MNKLRRWAAIIVGKLITILSKMLGNQGTNFSGRLARMLYPNILKDLAGNVKNDIFIITGTNGKTTTTNMFAEIIKESGYSFVHNRAGANMLNGITTAFIKETNLNGNKAYDYAILETDEANVPLILKELKPRFLLVTNFFRDQLDRYGELDNTINMIKEAVVNSGVELVLNSDDPLQSHFQDKTGLQCWYYGFTDSIYDSKISTESREGRYCVFCGNELEYETYHYAQLGKYHCQQCHNTNPVRSFNAHDLNMTPAIHLRVNELPISSPYQGFYNAYNILAAVSMAQLIGLDDTLIQKAIAQYQPRAGRMETFNINGKKVVLILIKNPTGLNQTLAMLLNDPASQSLFLALNDNAADGRDISWIWDANAELISQYDQIRQIICSGQRSGDMALRIKYTGYDAARIIIESDLKEGISKAIDTISEKTYILCTYTALFASRKILTKMQKKRPTTEEKDPFRFEEVSSE